MENRIDSDFLEKLIVKSMMVDKKILTLVCSVFESEYFDDPSVKYAFEYYQKHLDEFHQIAPTESIINSTEDKVNIKELFNEVNSIEYNITENKDHLLSEINFFLKDKAIKRAMVEGVDLIDGGGDVNLLREKIESALCKDIKIDLGLNYFKDLGIRLKKIFTATDYRIPSYFPQFDEYVNGGFPPFTLSVLVAKIHGGKCIDGDTNITVKNKTTGVIEYIQIKEFFQRFTTLYKYNKANKKEEVKQTMLGLEGMKKKYGDEEGTKRYNKWKKNVGKASKGRNTLTMFIKKYGEETGTKRHQTYIERQKNSSKRSINYWLKQGLTKEKAKKKVSEYQRNFSLDQCIKKHGEEKGTKIWQERQDKWQNTLKSKPQEEIDRINKLKSPTLENLQRKYGIKEGLKRWIRKNERFSKSRRQIDVEDITKFQQYMEEVRRISNQQIKTHGLKNSELRDKENYHLDHKVSISYGFNHNISTDIIGSIHNLEMLTAKDNLSKNSNNSIKPNLLIKEYNKENKV